jgi:hypothetical protein
MQEIEMEDLVRLYTSRVLKWRQTAVKAELEADQLRKQNYALRRIIYEAGI